MSRHRAGLLKPLSDAMHYHIVFDILLFHFVCIESKHILSMYLCIYLSIACIAFRLDIYCSDLRLLPACFLYFIEILITDFSKVSTLHSTLYVYICNLLVCIYCMYIIVFYSFNCIIIILLLLVASQSSCLLT